MADTTICKACGRESYLSMTYSNGKTWCEHKDCVGRIAVLEREDD